MKVKTSDDILYAILMLVGVFVYAICTNVSYCCLRAGQHCIDLGGVYSIGGILCAIPIALPFLLMFFSEERYLNKRPALKTTMYFLCSAFIVALVAYCITHLETITGRDITIEAFLTLYLLVLPIVYAVRNIKYGGNRRGEDKRKIPN